ncbi:MAG: response regulator [Acidobacteria bacterium]|nr:MAG: response regulator [Acidobacteriota bacterium]
MSGRILVVDDEPDVRTYLKTLLSKDGYQIEEASDGEEGLEVAQKVKPDLIFLDILMPKRTGIMLYRKLRKDPDLAKVPIVIVTGLTQYRSFFAQDFEEVPPPDAFVEKPPQREELLALAKKLMGATPSDG